MALSKSKEYIGSNPKFSLKTKAWPKLKQGQMEIVFKSLQPFGSEHSLEDLVKECISRGYRSTFTNPDTDIRKSILYHLNLLRDSGSVKEVG